MEASLRAVIFGRENFVARKLEEVLVSQGIKVNYGDDMEMPQDAAYVFDFEGREVDWNQLSKTQKLVVVAVDDLEMAKRWKRELDNKEINWRIVVGENVYGPGMRDDGFLGKAFYLAAKNKNLILPGLAQSFSVLAVEDLVEAILRACFLSGTRGELLVVSGEETNSKLVAEVLVDEAKMTRNQVIQNENLLEIWDQNLIDRSREILRWQAETEFSKKAAATVQYFVSGVDEENRRRVAEEKKETKYKKIEINIEKTERERVERRYEVVTEENPTTAMQSDGQANYELKTEKEKEVEFVNSEEVNSGIVNSKTEEKIEAKPDSAKSYVEAKDDEEPRVGKKIIWEEKENAEEVEEFKMESLIKKEAEKKEEIYKKEETPLESPLEKGGNKHISRIKLGNYWKWGVGVIAGILLIILVVNTVRLASFPSQIKATKTLIEGGKYEEAEKKIVFLKKENIKQVGMITGLIPGELGKELGEGVRAEGEAVELLESGLNIARSSQKIADTFFGNGEVEMKGELAKVDSEVNDMISKMGILQGRLSGKWTYLPGRFREQLDKYKNMLAEERVTIENIDKLIPILPEILGLDGKRREYMILLQNENEIRATGGFIGSYGILSIEGGKWLGFEVKDVYEADGQLKGHVEPPAEIKKYLGEAGWFMRDANWQASFPLAAKDIQWFLEKETGRTVDGVIGINLAVAKSYLGVIGEIFIPDFKEKINQSNLYEQAEFYSENKFFPGSVQKASFLGSLSKQLIEEIKSAKGEKRMALLETSMDLMERSEIQIALNEPKSAKVLMDAGWDGAIYEGKCNGNQCVADYLMVVESNVGVNKANYFLYRNLERQIEIGVNKISNRLKINYENTAKSNNWPGGDYKNYMRIYIPTEANVEEISWSENGSAQKIIISGADLSIKNIGNKKEVGFLITVPVGKKINMEFKYNQAIDLSKIDKFSYLSFVQKQSGYGDTGIVTLVSMPEGWQAVGVQPAASVVGGKLLFNQKLERDIRMGVEISK